MLNDLNVRQYQKLIWLQKPEVEGNLIKLHVKESIEMIKLNKKLRKLFRREEKGFTLI